MENQIFELQYAIDTFYFFDVWRIGHVDGRRFLAVGIRSCAFQKHR